MRHTFQQSHSTEVKVLFNEAVHHVLGFVELSTDGFYLPSE